MKTLQIGSISSGTMRVQDLVPTFMDELKDLDPEQHKQLEGAYVNLWPVDEDYDPDEWNEQQLKQAGETAKNFFERENLFSFTNAYTF